MVLHLKMPQEYPLESVLEASRSIVGDLPSHSEVYFFDSAVHVCHSAVHVCHSARPLASRSTGLHTSQDHRAVAAIAPPSQSVPEEVNPLVLLDTCLANVQ